MSQPIRDRLRWRSVAAWVLAMLPCVSAWGQSTTVNRQLWATPTRFGGMVSYEEISQPMTRSGMRQGMASRGALAYPLHAQRSEVVRYRLLADHEPNLASPLVDERHGGGRATDLSAIPGESILLEPTGESPEAQGMWVESDGTGADGVEGLFDAGSVGGAYDTCGSCGTCGCGDGCGVACGPGFPVCGPAGPLDPILTLRYTSIGLGVSGFKNASNLGADGSFGFHESLNYASPMPLSDGTGWGWQIGFRTVQSDLSGASFTNSQRNQTFFTTGAFRRTTVGLQGGIVLDYLRDVWYDHVDLSQVRGEISWKCPTRHEWGYWFAAGDRRDTTRSPLQNGRIETWEPTNIHAFFYRRRFACLKSAEGRFYAGFSDNQDGLVGADAALPINDRWLIRTSFTYLVPEEPTNAGGTQNEGWNLALAGVWHFGRNVQHQPSRYTPLLEVADNGTFFVDRVAP